MLFVTLQSTSAETVPKVLQVAHQTKRLWHHAGEEQELSQYVHYDKNPTPGKKRIIKLDDDDGKDKYKPPENLTVYLSKIPMPELQPKAIGTSKKQQHEVYDGSKAGDKQKGKNKEKEKEKDKRGGDKFFRRGRTNSDDSPAEGAMNAVPKLLKPEPNKLRNRSSHSRFPSQVANSGQHSPPHQSEFARSFYSTGGLAPGKLTTERQRPVSMYGGTWGTPTDMSVGGNGERPASSLTGLFDKLRTR